MNITELVPKILNDGRTSNGCVSFLIRVWKVNFRNTENFHFLRWEGSAQPPFLVLKDRKPQISMRFQLVLAKWCPWKAANLGLFLNVISGRQVKEREAHHAYSLNKNNKRAHVFCYQSNVGPKIAVMMTVLCPGIHPRSLASNEQSTVVTKTFVWSPSISG